MHGTPVGRHCPPNHHRIARVCGGLSRPPPHRLMVFRKTPGTVSNCGLVLGGVPTGATHNMGVASLTSIPDHCNETNHGRWSLVTGSKTLALLELSLVSHFRAPSFSYRQSEVQGGIHLVDHSLFLCVSRNRLT